MNEFPLPALALVCAYSIGAIPFGLLLARWVKGVDLREVGSGNIGATNAGRAMGRRWALLVFALDMAKGLVPTLAAGWLDAGGAPGRWLAVGCGLAAILGHCFPLYLGFRGGKGVATTVGVLIALEPLSFLIAGALWLLALALWRMVSLASLALGAGFPVVLALRHGGGVLNEQLPLFAFALLVAALIALRHRANIGRILAGNEHRVGERHAQGR